MADERKLTMSNETDFVPVTLRDIRYELEIRLSPDSNYTHLMDALAANPRLFGEQFIGVYDEALTRRTFQGAPAFLPGGLMNNLRDTMPMELSVEAYSASEFRSGTRLQVLEPMQLFTTTTTTAAPTLDLTDEEDVEAVYVPASSSKGKRDGEGCMNFWFIFFSREVCWAWHYWVVLVLYYAGCCAA